MCAISNFFTDIIIYYYCSQIYELIVQIIHLFIYETLYTKILLSDIIYRYCLYSIQLHIVLLFDSLAYTSGVILGRLPFTLNLEIAFGLIRVRFEMNSNDSKS